MTTRSENPGILSDRPACPSVPGPALGPASCCVRAAFTGWFPPVTCYDAQWLPTARVLPPHGQDRLPQPPDFRTSQKKGHCPSVGHGWVAGEDASSQGPKRMLTHEAVTRSGLGDLRQLAQPL